MIKASFIDLKFNLFLNLARCQRKLNEFENSIELCSKALEMKSNSFEAYYTRARAKRDSMQYETALNDLYEAEKLNGTNSDIKKLIVKIKEDLFKIHSGSTKSKVRSNKISGDFVDVSSSVNSTPMLSRKNTLKSGNISQEFDDKQLNSSVSSNKNNNKTTIFNIKFKEETNL